MNTKITINCSVVSVEIDPNNTDQTIETTTNAMPFEITGEDVKNFSRYFLRQQLNQEDVNHDFTGQEVLDAVLEDPLHRVSREISRAFQRVVEEADGDDYGKKLVALIGAAKVKEILDKA